MKKCSFDDACLMFSSVFYFFIRYVIFGFIYVIRNIDFRNKYLQIQ